MSNPSPGHGRDLLPTLAASACVVVTDWYPAFFLPKMIAAAARRLTVRLEAVDSNGVIPLAEHGRAFTAARFYRAFMQRVLREHVTQVPDEAPLTRLKKGPQLSSLPRSVTRRWPAASARLLTAGVTALSALPIDHTDPPRRARAADTMRPHARCGASSPRSSPATTRIATIQTMTGRAGCRRICISGTCRRMRCSRPS